VTTPAFSSSWPPPVLVRFSFPRKVGLMPAGLSVFFSSSGSLCPPTLADAPKLTNSRAPSAAAPLSFPCLASLVFFLTLPSSSRSSRPSLNSPPNFPLVPLPNLGLGPPNLMSAAVFFCFAASAPSAPADGFFSALSSKPYPALSLSSCCFALATSFFSLMFP